MERFVNEISSEFILFSRCGGDLLTVPRLKLRKEKRQGLETNSIKRQSQGFQDSLDYWFLESITPEISLSFIPSFSISWTPSERAR